jgi:hypothetical protein
MNRVLFSIGGAGNVFFEVLKMESIGENYTVSEFLVSKPVRFILKHTNHNNFFCKLFRVAVKKHPIAAIILLIDIFLAFLFRFTLFSVIQIRSIKAHPVVIDWLYLGYFQKNTELFDISQNKGLIRASDMKHNCELCIHIRGGDFLTYNSDLNVSYYVRAIENLKLDIKSIRVSIVTNDSLYAKKVMDRVTKVHNFNYEIISGTEISDFYYINSAKYLLCSNSTFALTAGLTSKNIREVVIPKELMGRLKYTKKIKGVEIAII